MLKLLKSVEKRAFELLPDRYKVATYFHAMRLQGRLERELLYLDRLLENCATALDIGANRGLYTFRLAAQCRKVIAFEPQAALARRLRAMGRSNVEVREVALSDREAEKRLYVPENNGELLDGLASLTKREGAAEFAVTTTTLDSLRLRDVSFVKIDVEGHEWEVIAGGRNTIRENRPLMLVEIEQRHLPDRTVRDVLDEIEGLGYKGHFLSQDGRLVSVAEFSEEAHQRPYVDDPFDPRYVNNFYFLPD